MAAIEPEITPDDDYARLLGHYHQAFDSLVEELKQDRSILAVMLCGSLSHDRVWEKSDIDLVLITIDDPLVKGSSLSINADGINVHTCMLTRSEFRKAVEGSVANSFMHSFLAKGRLVYTHDETISELTTRLQQVGQRDVEVQLLQFASVAVSYLYKAKKWLITRNDLDYTALWLLYAATPIAQIEVVKHGRIAGREVIPEASELNPELFQIIYTGLLNQPKDEAKINEALDVVEKYLESRASDLFAPIIRHLEESAEARSATEIEDYFKRNYGTSDILIACEYLSDLGIVAKVSTPARLTKKSNVQMQELAFITLGGPPDEF